MRRNVLVSVACAVLLAACIPPPPPPPPFGGVNLTFTPVMNPPGGAMTMAVRPAATSDPAIYVGTRDGVVHRFDGATTTTVLTIPDVLSAQGECGLLGMTFSPDGSKLYVHYSLDAPAPDTCASIVEEYAFDGGTFTADAGSARRLLHVQQPQLNHKGGSLLFGPTDGMLYVALGDGGGGNDQGPGHPPEGNGQSLSTLLGKILRIDPTDSDGPGGLAYTVPPDNPFVGTAGLDEIWAYGLRNPFRMSFDDNGDLWVGDVGQQAREEITLMWANHPTYPGGKAANLGWNIIEGNVDGPSSTNGFPPSYFPPVLAMDRTQNDRSVVGGYVYHGSAIPELANAYLFADFFHFHIRAMRANSVYQVYEFKDFDVGVEGVVAFGEDNDGELYIVSLYSGIYKIERA